MSILKPAGLECEPSDSLLDPLFVKHIKQVEDLKKPRANVQGRRYFGDLRSEVLAPAVLTVPSSQRGHKRPRRGMGRIKRTDAATRNDAPRWRLVKPSSITQRRERVSKFGPRGDVRPRIWAHNRAELLEILPGISKPVNGVSWENSDIPYLILEGPGWPEDGWYSEKSFELIMVRDFSCAELDLDLESASVPVDSLETFRNHNAEPPFKPSPSFYHRDGSRVEPVHLINHEDSKGHFDLCLQNPFVDSAEYHNDLKAMHLPVSAETKRLLVGSGASKSDERISDDHSPISYPTLIRSPTHCSSHFQFKPDCQICHPHIPSTTDKVDDELQLMYPSEDDEDLSSLLASNQPNMDHQISYLREGHSTSKSVGNHSGLPSASQHHPVIKRTVHVDKRIPKLIPVEIQTLIDAHSYGKPIAIISTGDCLLSPVPLPLEYGCNFLGFFFLTDVHAARTDSPLSEGRVRGWVNGQVKWKLRLHWTPGGEDLLPDGQKLMTPWWNSISLKANVHHTPEDTLYMGRKDLQNFCHSILPLDVLADPASSASGGLFPKGWYCVDCGKLNMQIFLRHRRCSGFSCKSAKQSSVGYAEPLELARGYLQSLSLVGPGNLAPKSVSTNIFSWADGMRTYCYTINDRVSARHIFTLNRRPLQVEADALFRDIQLHVELRRQAKGPGYFTHLIGSGDDGNSTAVQWEQAPACLRQARDLMIHQGRTYGETENCSVDQLTTFAWVTAGNGKGPVFHAQNGVLTVLCLGADAVLSLTPKSGFTAEEIPDRSPEASVDVEMTLFDSSLHAGLVEADPEQPDGTYHPPEAVHNPPEVVPRENKIVTKKPNNALVITLVHGDALVLAADDFEAHFKRTGTTILLIGTSIPDSKAVAPVKEDSTLSTGGGVSNRGL